MVLVPGLRLKDIGVPLECVAQLAQELCMLQLEVLLLLLASDALLQQLYVTLLLDQLSLQVVASVLQVATRRL